MRLWIVGEAASLISPPRFVIVKKSPRSQIRRCIFNRACPRNKNLSQQRPNFFICTHTRSRPRVVAWIKTAVHFYPLFLFHLWIVIRMTRDTDTNLIGATKKAGRVAGKNVDDASGRPETYVRRKRYLHEWCDVLKTIASGNDECFPSDQRIMGKARSAEMLVPLQAQQTFVENVCSTVCWNSFRRTHILPKYLYPGCLINILIMYRYHLFSRRFCVISPNARFLKSSIARPVNSITTLITARDPHECSRKIIGQFVLSFHLRF